MAISNPLGVRIRAAHLRQKLKDRHNNFGVIDALDSLSDLHLVEMADEHHRESIRFELAKRAQQPSEKLSALFLQACETNRASLPKKPVPAVEEAHTIDFESTGSDLDALYRACLKRVESITLQKPETAFSFEITDEDLESVGA